MQLQPCARQSFHLFFYHKGSKNEYCTFLLLQRTIVKNKFVIKLFVFFISSIWAKLFLICTMKKYFFLLFVYLSTYKKSKNTLPPAAVFKNLLQIFCGFYGNSQNLLRPCEKNINIKMWNFEIGVLQQFGKTWKG